MRITRFIQPAAFTLLVPAASGEPPAWWSEGEPPVIDVTATSNNHGPANIGQAKWVAKSALDALSAVNFALADDIESDLVGAGRPIPDWEPPVDQAGHDKNHAPLMIGQLKAISAPFYEHLHAAAPVWLESQLVENQTKDAVDSANFYPWTSATEDDQNYVIATIGQLKAVSSLRFADDNDTIPNQLSDLWEEIYFGQSGVHSSDEVLQPDGLTNKEKNDLGLDPNVDYSGSTTTQAAKFTYDLAGRLTGVTAPVASASFSPDEEGNILNAQ
jgi:hypothetical protein